MAENWDNSSASKPSAFGEQKLKGFGRGNVLRPFNREQKNGFGKPGETTQDRFGSGGGFDKGTQPEEEKWNGFGKPSGGTQNGFGKAGGTQPVDDPSDDWAEDAPPISQPHGGFDVRGGGTFGTPQKDAGAVAEDDDWNDDQPAATGFGKKGRGGFGRASDTFGGGATGSSGNSACFKCGETGHFSRECPKNQGGGGSSSCRKCGEEGHFARECPSGGGKGQGRSCHKCGAEGHFARECSNAADGGRNGFRSGGFGRRSPESDTTTQESGFSSFGSSSGQRNGRDQGCRKCGEEGHYARECPNKPDGDGKGGGCHKCGAEGHFARECPEAGADGVKPRENYVPPELDDVDTLFKTGIHQGINFDKYDNIAVEVTGNNRTKPIATFEDAELLPTFLKNVKRAGYTKPTPIQKHAIPAILAGRDLMGCAQTGSGKTAAFLLPVLTAIVNDGLTSSQLSTVQQPQAIVIVPTRELALQIFVEATKFSSGSVVRPVVVYGGTSVMHQARQLEKGANIVIGTPGRLLDFIEKGKIVLDKIKVLILDEADRMLDMGFEPAVRKLVETMGMPSKTHRQTLMFSATFKEEIQQLAADFLNNYLFITVGIVGGACSDVEQRFLEVDRMKKREHLCDILNELGGNKVLVFVGQKRNADFLASYLSQAGYPTTSIHGDRLQREREAALSQFTRGSASVLIATNVAARGLDIPEVAHVVNYDLPSDIDEYVHRIGRTGRCGNLGKATSFYNHDADYPLVNHLVRILAEAGQEVPDWLADYASSGGAEDRGNGRGHGYFASKDIRRRGKFDAGGNKGSDDSSSRGYIDNVLDDETWD